MISPQNERYGDAERPEQLMSAAERGFVLSNIFSPNVADQLRLGAAAMFAEGAGRLLAEKLEALGVTVSQIEKFAAEGMLDEVLQRLASQEMDEIKRRVGRIATSDPRARSALENEGYFSDYDQGRTQND